MKKMSIAAVVTIGLISVNAQNSFAANAKKHTNNNTNNNATEASAVSEADQATIKTILEQVNAAAQSGDEQLTAKLLASAVKANPKLADKIVAAFVESQSGKASPSVDVAAIINSVVASLQNQKGNEEIVAAVLSSYTPAAGNNANTNNRRFNLPPSLPNAGNLGDKGFGNLPRENPNQTSAH